MIPKDQSKIDSNNVSASRDDKHTELIGRRQSLIAQLKAHNELPNLFSNDKIHNDLAGAYWQDIALL